MTARNGKTPFAARPSDPERWVKAPRKSGGDAEAFSARLTIDVTPAQRGRIKIVAFQRGVTVADMLRELFAREYPDSDAGAR
jgi:hypothetical protein